MKKNETKNMTAAVIITLTGCLIQLVPVLDSHPIGSSVLVMLTLCWAMKNTPKVINRPCPKDRIGKE